MKDNKEDTNISFEILLISLVQMAVLIGSLWLITEPNNTARTSETYYKVNFYTSIAFGFFLVIAMIVSLASRQLGFGYIMLILSGVFFGELMRNTLSVQDRVTNTITVDNNRIFVVSNLVIVTSIVFSIVLLAIFVLEKIESVKGRR